MKKLTILTLLALTLVATNGFAAPPAQYYGQLTVILFPEDEANGQYIYADVTSGIFDYADQYEKGTLLSSVQDFFVFSDDGLTYGKPLNNNTKLGASLVSGVVFDPNMMLVGYYFQSSTGKAIQELPTSMQYQGILLAMVTAEAAKVTGNVSNVIRGALLTRIGQLSMPLVARYQAQAALAK